MFADSTYSDRFFLPRSARRSTLPLLGSSKVNTVANRTPGLRFQLWVDAVGGFLVCLGDEITIGQPAPGVDVPILADLSRRHARIRRSGEGYVLQPLQSVQIDAREVTEPTLLASGDLIELGGSVRLRFVRPHLLSSTARLDFVSHHRTQPPVDAVLLMSDTCVLGPKPTAHCVCRDWPHEVFLFRQADELHCRSNDDFEIDGRTVRRRGQVTYDSQVTGKYFSMKLEQV
jgi:hypothetical protein